MGAMGTESSFPASYFVLLGLLCGAVGFRIGWRARHRFVLPLAQGVLGWVAFVYAWRIHGPAMAAASVACWAVATTLVSLYFFTAEPRETDERVLRAAAYRETMLAWLRTGSGPESRPFATARAHLHELVVYLAAAVFTANLAALVLGAILLNFMNAWVATLLRAARRTWVVAVLGWGIWSLFRVAGYVLIGVAAAAPLAARLGYPAPPGSIRPLALAGAAGVVLDLALKLALSRPWGRRLAGAVDLDAAEAGRRHQEPFHLGLDDSESGPGPAGPPHR
jgi:hypothetical protein